MGGQSRSTRGLLQVLCTLGLLLAPLALAWQMLPSWLAPGRSVEATFVLDRGFIPPDAEGRRSVFVYALQDGVIVPAGRTTVVHADAIAAALDPAAGLDAGAAIALWLPRDLHTLWAGREQEIGPALDAHLARIALTIQQAVARLVADPEFRRRQLPKLESLIEQALAAEEVVAAQRRAIEAARNRFVAEFLPILKAIALDNARQSVSEGMKDLLGELAATLRGEGPEHLSLEAMINRTTADERFALLTEIMVLQLARDPAMLAYAEAVAAELAQAMAEETTDLSLAAIWSDPDLQPVAQQLSVAIEDEVRALAALLIFNRDRTAIDPIAGIVLRGILSDRHRYFVLIVPSDVPPERYAGLAQRAHGLLLRAPPDR